MGESAQQKVSRRDFMARCIKVGAGIAAVGGIALWRHDEHGPTGARYEDKAVSLPDFSVPGTTGRMGIARGKNRTVTLEKALRAVGGIETFIESGDHVLIKVNAAFAMPPLLSATTHPSLVSQLVQYCLKAGAAKVTVTDNPIHDPASAFALSGIEESAIKAGAKVVMPRSTHFMPFTLADGVLLDHWPILYEPFLGVNKLIGVAPVKNHHRSGASMTMKNWYGLLGGRRNVFHQDINNIIKELAMMVSPTFVVLDGTWSMMTNGPTGGSLDDLKATDTLIVSTDQVAADTYGASLLEKHPSELPYLAKAEQAGVGRMDLRSGGAIEG
jgi:uncharacterized protein (DUF362 family)